MNAWRYTDLRCSECGGIIVQDIWKLEYYCLNCGLIHEENVHGNDAYFGENKGLPHQFRIDRGFWDYSEWREENEYTRK